MGKRWILSLLGAGALSLGGWLASCGGAIGPSDLGLRTVAVPAGCTLISPSPLSEAPGIQVVRISSGRARFTLDCNGQQVEIDKRIAPGQTSVTIRPTEIP